MSWASFHVVEVMSSARAHLKSVGYLGAIQSFTEDTDVLMLTTNLLKKVSTIPPLCTAQFMRSSGLELYAYRYRNYAQWAVAHRHTRARKRLGSRTHCHVEPLEAAYTQACHPGDVQDVDEIPRGYPSGAAEAGGETGGSRPWCVYLLWLDKFNAHRLNQPSLLQPSMSCVNSLERTQQTTSHWPPSSSTS